MARRMSFIYVGPAILLALLIALPAVAANSFSNSLTGFSGNSTVPATQAALAAAGFNVYSTQGFTEDPPGNFFDPTIQFDSSGAHFGDLWGGDGGRNFMRTNAADYANYDFTAEVTIVVPMLEGLQASWLGLGAGDTALFGWPDWSTQFSSVMVTPESSGTNIFYTTMYTDNDNPIFANNPLPGLASGTHRLRLTLDRDVVVTNAVFSIDLNYAGGPFVSDFSAPALELSGLYGPDGWSAEPSRIYFGGDDGTVIKDFAVTVTGSAVVFGDLNSDGLINSVDWGIFRTNQETNLSGLSLRDAYFRGDLNKDLANNYADFATFKALYDTANGAGAFVAMLSGVPEPSTVVLLVWAGLLILVPSCRVKNRE
jgi:hypothetical protein